MLLGYARVSKSDDSQDTAAQVSALKSAGCTRVFEDRASGGRWDRPELHRLLVWISSGWATRSWSGSSIACPVPSRMAPRPPDPLRPAVTPARTVAPDRLIMRGSPCRAQPRSSRRLSGREWCRVLPGLRRTRHRPP